MDFNHAPRGLRGCLRGEGSWRPGAAVGAAVRGARARGAVRGVSLIVTKCGRCRPRWFGRLSVPKGEQNRPTDTTTVTHSFIPGSASRHTGASARSPRREGPPAAAQAPRQRGQTLDAHGTDRDSRADDGTSVPSNQSAHTSDAREGTGSGRRGRSARPAPRPPPSARGRRGAQDSVPPSPDPSRLVLRSRPC